MKKKILISFMCLLLLTGCGPIAKLEDGKELVAETTDIKITADDLYKEIKDRYARDILIEMIDKAILNKIYKDDDAMKNYIDSQITSIKSQVGEDQFLAAIKYYYGVNSESEMREVIKISYKKTKAVDDYIKGLVKEDEINNYYEKNIVGDMKVKHILIKPDTTTDMSSEEITAKENEALEKAKELITRIANGEDFGELAKEYSADTASAVNGGDIDFFNVGEMVEPFYEASKALKKGEYTKTPVKTTYGYHIILLVDQKEKATLEIVKDRIIEELSNDIKENNATVSTEAIIELRKAKKLVIHDSELKKQYDEYMKELLSLE